MTEMKLNVVLTKASSALCFIAMVCGVGIVVDVSQAAAPTKGETKLVELGGGTVVELVYIPSGEFLMGSTPEERAWAIGPEGRAAPGKGGDGRERFEGDPRLTRIKEGFWLGRTEVTVGQWRRFVDDTSYVTDAEKPGGKTQCFDLEWKSSSKVPPHPWKEMTDKSWRDPNFGFPVQDDHPVVCVSWNDTREFCRWLTEKERRAGRLSQDLEYRLPTDAEWEYACRGGRESTIFWWGNDLKDGEERLNINGNDHLPGRQAGWSRAEVPWNDGFPFLSPVDHYGQKGRNGFGLADMLGNVWEICLDHWDPKGAHEDVCLDDTPKRVCRGVSFLAIPGFSRCAVRLGLRGPSYSDSRDGFRLCLGVPRGAAPYARATEDEREIKIETDKLEAVIPKNNPKHWMTGIEKGSFLDKATGFREVGDGLMVIDWLMEAGSDEEYGDFEFAKDGHGLSRYLWHTNETDPARKQHAIMAHGSSHRKRAVEGPQLCHRMKPVQPEIMRGKDFVAVTTTYQYEYAAPGRKPGSRWTQLIVFPQGKRYFVLMDRIDTVNDSDEMFLRNDTPGCIRHDKGDTFSEIYLSYLGGSKGKRIPSSEFFAPFPPDAKFGYRRDTHKMPEHFIRAYRLRDKQTGNNGPWLAGMTLEPSVVYEAWCSQRPGNIIVMIEEIHGKPTKAGDTFSAAHIVGYFDTIEEMHAVYDKYKGHTALSADESGWHLEN